MLALREYQAGVHGRCGIHRDVASDPDIWLTPDHEFCEVCKVRDQFERSQRQTDEEELKKAFPGADGPPPDAPHPADGRTLVIRAATPQEVARAKASTPPAQ